MSRRRKPVRGGLRVPPKRRGTPPARGNGSPQRTAPNGHGNGVAAGAGAGFATSPAPPGANASTSPAGAPGTSAPAPIGPPAPEAPPAAPPAAQPAAGAGTGTDGSLAPPPEPPVAAPPHASAEAPTPAAAPEVPAGTDGSPSPGASAAVPPDAGATPQSHDGEGNDTSTEGAAEPVAPVPAAVPDDARRDEDQAPTVGAPAAGASPPAVADAATEPHASEGADGPAAPDVPRREPLAEAAPPGTELEATAQADGGGAEPDGDAQEGHDESAEASPMTAPPDAAFVGSFGSAVKAGEAPAEPPARRPRRSDAHLGVDLALRTLVVPPHVDGFWDDLAQRVGDEPQLRLRPRAAVRPITQPPPIIDDRILFTDGRGPSPRRTRRRRMLLAAVAAVVALGVVGLVTKRDEGTETAGTTTTAAPATTTTAAPGTPTQAPAPPAPPPIDPAAPITPNAVGRLPIPASARDLTNSGLLLQVDQRTFEASGRTCYDARVAGVPDLLLRFRSPDPTIGVVDQADGVLATVTVEAGVGSPRLTDAGFGLGTPEEQVRTAYGEAVEDLPHPFVTGGHILRIPNPEGNGNGIAYFTDGRVVTAIAAGQYDVIAVPDGCV